MFSVMASLYCLICDHMYMICNVAGWSNSPGKPTVKVANLTEHATDVSMLANVTWSPPQYLGGLNASDIYYQLKINDYDINTTDTYSLLSYDGLRLRSHRKVLDITLTVHYNGSAVDALYIPNNMLAKKRYNHLLCETVGEQTANS